MPKITYINKKFQQKSLDLLALANQIIEDYQSRGYDLTLRQLYYQLVARDYIANNERSYKKLGSLISDARDAGLVDWFEQQWGTPDVLVNSAGINVARRAIADLDPAEFDRIMAINNTGTFNCIHAVLPGMRSRGSGLIVNISSIAGKRAMKLGGAGYCASKFAVSALATTIGLEERDNGIHVTNIYPGEVNTPILAERPTPVPPEKLAKMLLPEDLAAMVVAIAKLPDRAIVPELVITPLYQEYA